MLNCYRAATTNLKVGTALSVDQSEFNTPRYAFKKHFVFLAKFLKNLRQEHARIEFEWNRQDLTVKKKRYSDIDTSLLALLNRYDEFSLDESINYLDEVSAIFHK